MELGHFPLRNVHRAIAASCMATALARADLRIRAGLPATTAPGGTSRVTTLPAPTIAFSPMVTPQSSVAPDPMEAPRFTSVLSQDQSASVWSAAGAIRRPGITVVDERHIVADEHLVLDRHSFANEGVAGDLAAVANPGALLNFHKGPDLHFVANFAAVEIGETIDAHPFAEFHIRRDAFAEFVAHNLGCRVRCGAWTSGGNRTWELCSVSDRLVAPLPLPFLRVPLPLAAETATTRGRRLDGQQAVVGGLNNSTGPPPSFRDCEEASRMRTSSRPRSPLVSGARNRGCSPGNAGTRS